ncbi:hypothetical protein [Streptomyces sp. NPDC059757]|uniref:hypothetical protein n=1 Tax=Streptomyces sp. NPDC059757 TaxID=3346935 RepID=UPI0036478489
MRCVPRRPAVGGRGPAGSEDAVGGLGGFGAAGGELDGEELLVEGVVGRLR